MPDAHEGQRPRIARKKLGIMDKFEGCNQARQRTTGKRSRIRKLLGERQIHIATITETEKKIKK